MAICSLCGSDRKLTREHIWSRGLLELYSDIAPMTFDQERGIAHRADPVVRDICAECNHGMSAADAAMIDFARKHLTRPIPVGTELRWWTSYTHEITSGGSPRDLIVFFGPWEDLTPPQLQLADQGILSASTATFDRIPGAQPEKNRECIRRTWIMRVGYGAFLLVAWNSESDLAHRHELVDTLRSFGWLQLPGQSTTTRTPFNLASCVVLGAIEDPDRHGDRIG